LEEEASPPPQRRSREKEENHEELARRKSHAEKTLGRKAKNVKGRRGGMNN